MFKNMTIINEWRSSWRLVSMQMMTGAAAIQLTWAGLGDDLKESIPHWIVTTLTLCLLGIGIMGRLIKQNPSSEQPKGGQ